MEEKRIRCWETTNPLFIEYHDKEWGAPVHDDKILFEFLLLEGFQAGLSWELILKKRESLREAFDGFDPQKISEFTNDDVERLMSNPEIIRNKLKIRSAIHNARIFLKIREEFGSFDTYIWRFVGGLPIKNNLRSFSEIPSQSRESETMSKDLKRRGFKFVGPKICYSFMQAVGMVNDHLTRCFRFREI